MKRLLSFGLGLTLIIGSCGDEHHHGDGYELQSIDKISKFVRNPLQPKERPMQSYQGRDIKAFDIHLHPGSFRNLGPLGQEFILDTIQIAWLPDSIKKGALDLLSRFMLSPYGLGIGIQQECFRAKMSGCGLFATHAPKTWGITDNDNIIKALNDKKNELYDNAPYFYGFATIDMQQWLEEPVLAEKNLRRALEHPHMVAIKLAFIHNNVPLNEPGYDRVYELAAAYNKPVYHHIGSTPLRELEDFETQAEKERYLRSYDPQYLEEAIARHPNTDFILGHMGFDFNNEGNDFIGRSIAMAEKFSHVYLEMSAFGRRSYDPEGAVMRRVLKDVKAAGLVDRLIYGSDGPGFPGATKTYIEDTLAAMEAVGYSFDEAQAVLYNNFASITTIDL